MTCSNIRHENICFTLLFLISKLMLFHSQLMGTCMQDCRVKSAASLLTKRRDLSSFFFGVQNPDTNWSYYWDNWEHTRSSHPYLAWFFCNIWIYLPWFDYRGRQSFVNSTSKAKQYGVLEECDWERPNDWHRKSGTREQQTFRSWPWDPPNCWEDDGTATAIAITQLSLASEGDICCLLINDPSTCLHCNSHFSCLLYLSFIIEAEKFFLCHFIFQLDFVLKVDVNLSGWTKKREVWRA